MSEPQHIRALKVAQQRRLRIAEIKRLMHDQQITLGEALRDPANTNMFAFDVASWQYRYGPATTRRLLTAGHVPLTARCGAMTEHQIDVLDRLAACTSETERRDIIAAENRRWAS